jgi:hypothetical protein
MAVEVAESGEMTAIGLESQLHIIPGAVSFVALMKSTKANRTQSLRRMQGERPGFQFGRPWSGIAELFR